MPNMSVRTSNIVRGIAFSILCAYNAGALSPESYLPLKEGNKWVLRNGAGKGTVSFEVLSRDGDGYRVRFASPFGTNDWTLVPRGGKVILSQFGKDGQMMDLPGDPVYFDFTAPARHSWKIVAGDMSIREKDATVQSAGRSYDSAIRIQQGKNMVYTFAPDVGFVQFGAGKDIYTLDESASRLSGVPDRSPVSTAAPVDDSRPVQHVPGGSDGKVASTKNRAPVKRNTARGVSPKGPSMVGITVNTFAKEKQTPQNLLSRWKQSLDTGVNFVVSSGKWNELEPKKGNHQLDSLNFQVSEAQKNGLYVAYTLRLIDTVARTMPSDLERKKWTDPEMERRVIALIEAMAPLFKDRVKWFMFGNEIDGYFGRHPDEIEDFASLYDRVAKRLKELVPGILVSSTIMYGGIETLDDSLGPLNDRFDFLAITYYPIRGDFTMKDPGIVKSDFQRMRKAAEGRGVVLQEIGYATSSVNGSSERKQAQFIRNVFAELQANRDVFEGGSFFLLADLSDSFVKDLAKFYGMPNAKTFLGFLQTTGLFDSEGNPKEGWSVFQSEVQRLRR